MLNYKHNEVKKGDMIKSSEWNNLGFGVHGLFNDDITIYGNKAFKGKLSTADNLTVSGILNAQSDLKLTGSLNALGSLKVTGDTALTSLTVSGDTLLAADTGRVGIGTAAPQAKLDINGGLSVTDKTDFKGDVKIEGKTRMSELTVNGAVKVLGPVVRKVHIATGLGPNDGTDSGQIKSRILTFTKQYEDTAVRIVYCDIFRIIGDSSAGARWTIKVNGDDPPGGALYFAKFLNGHNHHDPATFTGHAIGIPAGECTITVWVGDADVNHKSINAYTGWYNSRWTIEAEEVLV